MEKLENYWKSEKIFTVLLTSGRVEEESHALLLSTETPWEQAKGSIEHFISKYPNYQTSLVTKF